MSAVIEREKHEKKDEGEGGGYRKINWVYAI